MKPWLEKGEGKDGGKMTITNTTRVCGINGTYHLNVHCVKNVIYLLLHIYFIHNTLFKKMNKTTNFNQILA